MGHHPLGCLDGELFFSHVNFWNAIFKYLCIWNVLPGTFSLLEAKGPIGITFFTWGSSCLHKRGFGTVLAHETSQAHVNNFQGKSLCLLLYECWVSVRDPGGRTDMQDDGNSSWTCKLSSLFSCILRMLKNSLSDAEKARHAPSCLVIWFDKRNSNKEIWSLSFYVQVNQ